MSWNVWFEEAFRAWVDRTGPTTSDIDAVSLWISMAEIDGPPADSHPVRDDFYWAAIPATNVRAEFLAIGQDQLIIIRAFR